MTYRSDTGPIGGRFTQEENAELAENTDEAFPLEVRAQSNPFWAYSLTAEDNGIAGSLDLQPGLTYLGPAGIFIVGFDNLDAIEGTITGEATDEIDIAVYKNSVDTIECDEGDTEYPTSEAVVEFNLADTQISMATGDVLRFVRQMAASNEDDPDTDWNLTQASAWSIRPQSGQSIVIGTDVSGALFFSVAAATTIVTAGTPVKAAGTTAIVDDDRASTDRSQVTVATTNRLTYDGTPRRRCMINADVALSHADVEGATQRLGAQLFLNGVIVQGAEAQADVDANGQSMVSVHAVLELCLNDFLELYVSNEESTANVTVQHGTMSIQAL